MVNKKETSLIIRKETIFDKIRIHLTFLFSREFYQEEFQILQRMEDFTQNRTPKPTNIIIPREIKKRGKGME